MTMMTMIIMRTIKHYYQPTGNSCGPACIFMVSQHINPSSKMTDNLANLMIDEISEICGTDWVVGTPPERMDKGMKLLKLKFVEYLGSPRPYDLLHNVIKSDNYPILRTITKGVPHWIIVQDYNDDGYEVLDPWLGEIFYSKSELDDIWSPRLYQFYEVMK